jgi:hypothetical protein
MLYCRKHDLAFCSFHKNECLDNCKLEEEARAEFCVICSGLLMRKSENKITNDQIKIPNKSRNSL